MFIKYFLECLKCVDIIVCFCACGW